MKTFRQLLKPLLVALALGWVALPVAAEAAQRVPEPVAPEASRSASAREATFADLWSGVWKQLAGLASARAPESSVGTAGALTSTVTTCGTGCSEMTGAIDPDG